MAADDGISLENDWKIGTEFLDHQRPLKSHTLSTQTHKIKFYN